MSDTNVHETNVQVLLVTQEERETVSDAARTLDMLAYLIGTERLGDQARALRALSERLWRGQANELILTSREEVSA